MAHEYGVRLALIAFATCLLQGVLGRAGVTGTLQTALLALAGFYAVGWLCGEMARRAVEESLATGKPEASGPPASNPASSSTP